MEKNDLELIEKHRGSNYELDRLYTEHLKLDEEVAAHMVEGFGGVITQLTSDQAKYINVPVEGPFKPETYKY